MQTSQTVTMQNVPQQAVSAVALLQSDKLTDEQRTNVIANYTANDAHTRDMEKTIVQIEASDRRNKRLWAGVAGGGVLGVIWLLLYYEQAQYVPHVIALVATALGSGGVGYAIGKRQQGQ